MTENSPPSIATVRRGSEREKCPKDHQAVIALELILDTHPNLYCSIVGEPCIGFQSALGSPQWEEWPLRSGRVRAWIAEYVWAETRIVLRERDITRILTVLEGKAWHAPRVDVELKDALDQEPVLEAIFIFVNRNSRYEGTSTKLFEELQGMARKYGVDVKSRAWPGGPPQLSRRINTLKPLLRKADILVETGRRGGGDRYILLEKARRGDDADRTPSLVASVDKLHHPRTLHQSDGGDSQVFTRLRPPCKAKGEDSDRH